jgi:uncharacterized glyoxalase superfamily protein PhnB
MQNFGHLFIQPRDFTKSFSFFTETLGWKVTQSFGDGKDASRLAFLTATDGLNIVLAEDHDTTDASKKPELYKEKGRMVLHFDVKDVDASFSKIKDGAHVKVRPENNHWGTRWFLVEDPDGHQFAWQGPKK